MEHVVLEAAQNGPGPATEKRPLGRALGTEHVAVNYFELEPGETFGFGYHRHPDQEEAFYVIEGTATFETEAGDVEVAAGEAIRFAPGEWQLGRNESGPDGERVVALGLGAPADAQAVEMVRECKDCQERTPHRIEPRDEGAALVTVCADCDGETGRYR